MSAPGQHQSPFPIVLRGYDRDQVTDHIRRLDAELQMLAADRDSAHANADQLHDQLEQARSQMHALQRDVDELSVPPTTVAGMSDRVSRMLQLATDEAAELRANAREEAAETVSIARQDALATRESATADAARTRELAQEHADTLVLDAQERAAAIDADAQRLRQEIEAERLRAQDRVQALLAEAEAQAQKLRDTAQEVSLTRLRRSRELAAAAHEAHKQILDHLEALREHIGDLPGALALSDDENALIALDADDDLAVLNRTLVGSDRFADVGTAVEATDVLDVVADSPADLDSEEAELSTLRTS